MIEKLLNLLCIRNLKNHACYVFSQIATTDNFEEFLSLSIIIFILYTYMFISNYTAQEVTDQNNHVFATV